MEGQPLPHMPVGGRPIFSPQVIHDFQQQRGHFQFPNAFSGGHPLQGGRGGHNPPFILGNNMVAQQQSSQVKQQPGRQQKHKHRSPNDRKQPKKVVKTPEPESESSEESTESSEESEENSNTSSESEEEVYTKPKNVKGKPVKAPPPSYPKSRPAAKGKGLAKAVQKLDISQDSDSDDCFAVKGKSRPKNPPAATKKEKKQLQSSEGDSSTQNFPGVNFVFRIGDVSGLKTMQKMDSSSTQAKLIKDYVFSGLRADGEYVSPKVHNTYEWPDVSGQKPQRKQIGQLPEAPVSLGFLAGDNGHRAESPEEPETEMAAVAEPEKVEEIKLLLWSKTTPKGVQSLNRRQNGCMAFYDCCSRAFSIIPRNIPKEKEFRSILLLCEVSVGKTELSPDDYKHWSVRGSPSYGFDSVRAEGRIGPDWHATEKIDGALIPTGPVRTLDTNAKREVAEYYVFEGSRVEIKFAVDIELRPAGKHYPKDFDD